MTIVTTGPRAEVSFWGTRGGISTPGRGTEKYGGNTPCVSIAIGDQLFWRRRHLQHTRHQKHGREQELKAPQTVVERLGR